MHYQISRNGQFYGPYTIDDLRRYLGTGNVLANDLVKSDEMADWVTVEQLLAAPAPVPPPATDFVPPTYAAAPEPQVYATFPQQPVYADPSLQSMAVNPALANSPYEDAPNLHWGLVLLFSVLTCSLFGFIWDIVISLWLRKVQPSDKSLYWYLGSMGLYLVRWVVRLVLFGLAASSGGDSTHFQTAGILALASINTFLWLVAVGLLITANFIKRASLLEHFNGPEPVGLRLSGVMTFFFGGLYHQYHLNNINAMKQAARYGAPRAF